MRVIYYFIYMYLVIFYFCSLESQATSGSITWDQFHHFTMDAFVYLSFFWCNVTVIT